MIISSDGTAALYYRVKWEKSAVVSSLDMIIDCSGAAGGLVPSLVMIIQCSGALI